MMNYLTLLRYLKICVVAGSTIMPTAYLAVVPDNVISKQPDVVLVHAMRFVSASAHKRSMP